MNYIVMHGSTANYRFIGKRGNSELDTTPFGQRNHI